MAGQMAGLLGAPSHDVGAGQGLVGEGQVETLKVVAVVQLEYPPA
jgi:hypothetical protein